MVRNSVITLAYLGYHALKCLARSTLGEIYSTSIDHIGNFLGPSYRSCQLGNEVGFNFIRIGMGFSSLAEGRVVTTAVKGRARNPEATGKLRSSRILGSSICETVAIYGLVLAILLIFVANPIALAK